MPGTGLELRLLAKEQKSAWGLIEARQRHDYDPVPVANDHLPGGDGFACPSPKPHPPTLAGRLPTCNGTIAVRVLLYGFPLNR